MKIKEKWVSWEEFDLLFPGLSPTSVVDYSRVGGLTPGSIPFADASGMLTEDNATLFWDETNARLGLNQVVPTARIDIVAEAAFPGINISAGAVGEMSTPDGEIFRWGHWNGVDTFTERLKFDDAGLFYVSYLSASSVVFAGAGGEIKQDNVNLRWDDANNRLGVGCTPAVVLDVEGAGETEGGTSYGGVVARFRTTDDKHVSVSIEANTGKDPVLCFAENVVCIWDVRNDASATDEFQIRYQVAEVNRTDFKIDNAGNVSITTGTLSLIQPLDITSATEPLISLIPTFTGTGDVIEIIPSNPLDAGSTWDGFEVDMNALDPAGGAACTVHGFHVKMSTFVSDDGNAVVAAYTSDHPAADSSTGFSDLLRELTLNKTQNSFRSFGGTLVLSATGTYNGLLVDWDNITRDGGAPVLQGIHVLLPADYTNYGTSHAGYFEGDGRSVTICDTTYALDVSGTTRITGTLSAVEITDLATTATNVAAGTTGQRPAGIVGDIRYNSTLGLFEIYTGVWTSITANTDVKVAVDNAAVADYIGAAFNDGVLRVSAPLSYADGGNFVTLGVDGTVLVDGDFGSAGFMRTDGAGNYSIVSGDEDTVNHNLFMGKNAGVALAAGALRNIFFGEDAAKAITTGDDNVIIGYQAALHNVTGLKNVVIGYQAGLGVAVNSYSQNVLIGYQAGLGFTTGYNNVCIGHQAGAAFTNQTSTVAIGYQALEKCTVGGNVAIGKSAAELCTSASGIVAIGNQALDALTTGDNHVAIGTNALGSMQTASDCVAIGIYALALATAAYNIGIGAYAGAAITLGYRNIALGGFALNKADEQIGNVAIGDNSCMYVKGHYNIGIGAYACQSDVAETAVQHNVCIGYEAGKDIKFTAGTEGHYNLFVGTQAGRFSSLGISNTAMGYKALYYNLNGDYNVSIGYESGGFLKGATNDINNMICIGYRAGSSLETNTTAPNILIGSNAGRLMTTGGSNIAIGDSALDALTTGFQCCAIGLWALSNCTGNYNVAIGNKAGTFHTSGAANVYLGVQAGYYQTTGSNNTFLGHDAGKGTVGMTVSNTIAIGIQSLYRINSGATGNTAIGFFALNDLTTGDYNTVIGYGAGQETYTTSSRNTFIGYQAGLGVATNIHNDNTFIGYIAGKDVTTGGTNTFIGSKAGEDITAGDGNVVIGYMAASGQLTVGNNQLWIANSNTATPLIYGDFPNTLLKVQATNFNVIGICNLGDGGVTNYAEIKADGEVNLHGTARVINGQWIDAQAIKAPQTNPATLISFGILETPAYRFADAVEVNQENVTFNMRLPYRMDKGVAPFLAIGWSAEGISPGNCRWQLEYLFTKLDDNTALGPQDTVLVTSAASATTNGLVVVSLPDLEVPEGTDLCVHCRVTRLSADVLDTISDTVEMHGVCLSFTVDRLGLAT